MQIILSVLIACSSLLAHAEVLYSGHVVLSGIEKDDPGQPAPAKFLQLERTAQGPHLVFHGSTYRAEYKAGFKQWRGEFSEEIWTSEGPRQRHVLLSLVTDPEHLRQIARAPSKYHLPAGPLSYFADFLVHFYNPWDEVQCDLEAGDNAFVMYKETVKDRPDGLDVKYFGNCARL